MPVSWSDLTITPDGEAVAQLRESWRWRLGDDWSPRLFSAFGDVFLLRPDGVAWLNTGTGELELVAADEDDFRTALGGDQADAWFLPPLVEALQAQGKRLAPGECYGYRTFPIFAEGKYVPENFNPVQAGSHFALSGDLHRQIRDLPDGAKVEIKITP